MWFRGSTQVCHLHHAIYGLKKSPRAWFKKFNQIILSQGLTPCEVDPTAFQTSNSVGCIIVVVYVDDIHFTESDIVGIT